jgi:hypothetical protein
VSHGWFTGLWFNYSERSAPAVEFTLLVEVKELDQIEPDRVWRHDALLIAESADTGSV